VHAYIYGNQPTEDLLMFNIDKALNNVGGSLVATGKYDKGGLGTYPTMKVLVHVPDNKYHPYVVWTAIDSTCDGVEPHFCQGYYRETLEEAYEALGGVR
jgi:hypothetical protein